MAAPISVEAIGIKELNQRLDQVSALTQPGHPAHQAILSRAILQFHRFMSSVVPVDTGRLKNSLHPFVEDNEGSIRTNVIYALPVEANAGYVKRTVDEEGPRVGEHVIVALQGEIHDAFSA